MRRRLSALTAVLALGTAAFAPSLTGVAPVTTTTPARTAADGPPSAIATIGDGDATVGQVLTFDATASQNAAEVVWDFGDGYQATGPVVTHAYTHGGAYVAQVLVRNDHGAWAKEWYEVRVAPYIEGKVTRTVTLDTVHGAIVGVLTLPDAEGTFPTILEYGPYNVGSVGDSNWNRTLIRSGYAYAKFAMPGRSRSGGEFDMFGPATAEVGHDVVEWIAAQDFSDGQVALAGFSGPAVAAFATLTTDPPHLVTAAVKGSFTDFYRDEVHVGGTTNSNTFVTAWNALFYAEIATSQEPETARNIPFDVSGQTRAQANMLRPTYDEWWVERTFDREPLDIPVLYHGTHRDLWPRALGNIVRWVAPAGGRVVGMYGGHGPVEPTGYGVAMHTGSGGYGEVATGETRAWFDHHLKGIDHGVMDRPALSLLVPRDADWNASRGYDWIGLDGWPASDTRYEHLPLHGGATALGGAGWGLTGSAEVDGLQQVVIDLATFDHDVTVAGPAALTLVAALDGVDASWHVQVEQVLPDGSVRAVNDGALQASHAALDESRTLRDGDQVIEPFHPHDALVPVMPTALTRYEVELPALFNTFTAGSTLRLRITTNDARPVLDGHATAPTTVRFTVDGTSSVLHLPVVDDVAGHRLPLPYTAS